MQWLQQTHTQRWHSHYHNAGEGRLYQGRFKAFPVQCGFVDWQHVRRVCRYVERNALRAGLVKRAEQWRWGSLCRRSKGTPEERTLLAPWPEGAYPGDAKWTELVNAPLRQGHENALRESMARGRPLGDEKWIANAAAVMGLGHTLRARGRPHKDKQGSNGS
jgi:putative transposase